MARLFGSEDIEQETVMEWARLSRSGHPELFLLHHTPNGGTRNRGEAAKLQKMGVLSGVPDLHLPVPKGKYSSLYIEMKYDDGRLSHTQKDFLSWAAGYGNYCCVCYTAEEAIQVLKYYLALKDPDSEMPYSNLSILNKGSIKVIQ